MKILDRYIIKSFIAFFLVTQFIFLTLVLLVKLVDQMEDITKSHVSADIVVQYLLYLMPQSLSRTVPIAVVISVLLLLLVLHLHHEFIAIQASGIAKLRLAITILLCASIVCVLLWGINEYIVPDTIDKAKTIKITKIEKQLVGGFVTTEQTWLRGPGGEFYSIGLVGSGARDIQDIQIMKLNPEGNHIMSDIIIQKGTWDNKSQSWNLINIRERIFDKDQILLKETLIPQKTMDMGLSPKDFIQIVQTPDQMSTRQLRDHLLLLQKGGLDTRESTTLYYLRFANSLGPLILAIIGLAYGFVMTRNDAASGIAWAILISIFYIILTQFGVTLGKSGVIPPIWSAWFANIVIGGWGLFRLKKALS